MADILDSLSLSLLFNAITLGAIYALIAVGYTMVYGIIQLINFAHGEIIMAGTYVGLLAVTKLGVPLALATLLAMGACAMLGLVLDFGAYLPLRRKHSLADTLSIVLLVAGGLLSVAYFEAARRWGEGPGVVIPQVLLALVAVALFALALLSLLGRLGRPRATVISDRLSALITAIGMSLCLQTAAQLIWTADYRSFPDDRLPGFLAEAIVTVGQAKLLGKELLIWLSALVLMGALGYLVSFTRVGKAMRACAQDKNTAALMGVNVNAVIAITFMVGSAMAAVAGILYAIKVGGNISPRMGYYPGVIAFAAAVLGGIGSVRGAVAGGFLIGLTQAFGPPLLVGVQKLTGVTLLENPTAYEFAFAFGLMILVILFRPHGLFGKAAAKRA